MIALQDVDKAIEILQAVLSHLRKRFGYSNYRISVILNNIGICHYELGGLLSALKSFEESVEILREAIARKSEQDEDNTKLRIFLGRSLQNLAFIRFKRRDYVEAIVALEESLKVHRDVFGVKHKLVKATIEDLAFIMATANCLDNKDKLNHMTAMYIEMLESDYQ